jgi:hypothetical protein
MADDPEWFTSLQREMSAEMRAVVSENGIRGGVVTAGIFADRATDLAVSFLSPLQQRIADLTAEVEALSRALHEGGAPPV